MKHKPEHFKMDEVILTAYRAGFYTGRMGSEPDFDTWVTVNTPLIDSATKEFAAFVARGVLEDLGVPPEEIDQMLNISSLEGEDE